MFEDMINNYIFFYVLRVKINCFNFIFDFVFRNIDVKKWYLRLILKLIYVFVVEIVI